MSDSIADQMQVQLARYRELRQHAPGEEVFRDRLYALQAWQSARMRRSHQGLLADPVYRDATDFFLTDVYGGVDLTRLTQDIERAMRAALRVLPEKVMSTSLLALELNALSQWLDERLATVLFDEMGETVVTMDAYLEAFRTCCDPNERVFQAKLVRRLGVGLDKYIRSRMIYTTFKLVKKPAMMAGIDALYGFMDKCFTVMRPMGSASEVIHRIVDEEERLMQRLYDGHPAPYGFSEISTAS